VARAWSADLFEKAKKEDKFVLLDLQAVWCHWCHVMEDTTYQDPKVIGLIGKKYIPVRVDQDANPDLSLRYEGLGVAGHCGVCPDGSEIVKRRGFIEPQNMQSLLQAIINDPTPGPSITKEPRRPSAANAFLTDDQKKILEEEHFGIYDFEYGGWGSVYKLIDPDNMELALQRAQAGNKDEEKMARQTLDQALNLLDREWGGFYQYSDQRNWKSPHFEKIASIKSFAIHF